MKTFFLYLIRFSIALILGGVAVVAAVVAPSVFTVVTDKHVAGDLMAEIFHRLNWISLSSVLLLLISEIFRAQFLGGLWFVIKRNPTRTFLLLLLTGFFIYIAFWITPELNNLRQSVASIDILPKKFGTLHRLSEVLYSINFLIAMVLLFLYRRES